MTRHTYMPVCVVSGSVILRGDATARQHPFKVIPLSASAEINSYRQADTFDVEFDAARFPFHTDDIRSMSVEVFMFERPSIAANIDQIADSQRPLVVGRVDESSIRLSADGRTFSARGKDYTEVLTVRKWDPRKTVAVGQSLPDAVQRLVDEAAGAEEKGRVLLVNYIFAAAEGVFARPFGAFAKVPMVEGKGTRGKGLTWPEGVNYWDVISDLCAQYGKRVFVRGLEVVISAPADLVTEGQSVSASQPVRSRAAGAGILQSLGTPEVSKVAPGAYRMAWGRNITELEITKKVGGERTPQQRVKCYDAATRKTLVGQYPKTRGKDDPEAQVRIVHGADQAALDEMARTAWHEISQGESDIEFETSDLADLAGKSLLEMRAADSIHIDHDPLRRDELAKMSATERRTFLMSAGFDPGVAAALAENFASLERWNRVYYVRRVALDWSHDDGITIKVGAANFLGQRAETQLQPEAMPIDDGTVAA